jgi:hypothetical protein
MATTMDTTVNASGKLNKIREAQLEQIFDNSGAGGERSQQLRAKVAMQLRANVAMQLQSLLTHEVDHKTLKQLKDALQSLESTLNSASLPTERSVELAAEVFNIPEILEAILCLLPTSTLLGTFAVNKSFRSGIYGSSKLMCKLGLKGDKSAWISFPADFIKNWNFHKLPVPTVPGVTQSLGPSNLVSFSRSVLKPLRHLGAQCSSMLICQPPVSTVKISDTGCCSRLNRGLIGPFTPPPPIFAAPTPIEVVNAKEGSSGVTIGDVNDAVERLMQQHRTCPHAYVTMHEDDGFVSVIFDVRFQIQTTDLDPKVIK